MTDLELLRSCIDSEYVGSDGFRVVVNELIYEDYVIFDNKFQARNLGQYPTEIGGEDNLTHLWIECNEVRRYLSKLRK